MTSNPRGRQLPLDGLGDVDQAHTPVPRPRPIGASTRRPQMSEAQLLAAVRKLARMQQWLCYHTADSRHSEAGWPDLVLLSVRQHRLLIVELKAEDGRVSPEQHTWLGALAACGIETGIWRPSDLVDVPAILAGRRLDPTDYGIQPLTPELLRWRR